MANDLRKTVEKVSKQVLTNKYVLYATLIVAIMNIVGYLATHNFVSLTIFALIGLLTSHFTNNMTLTLLVTIFAAGALHLSKRTVEAMTNKNKNKKNSSDDEDENSDNEDAGDEDAGDEDAGDEDSDSPVMTTPSKVNHQNTVQESYSQLNNILGDKKFKKMTKDTNTLIQQQNKLTESLQAMTPLLQSAQGMLKDINVEGINSMLSSFSDISEEKKE
jgi:hypothetical protein